MEDLPGGKFTSLVLLLEKFNAPENLMFVRKSMDETTRLPCWLPRGQQVSHEKWIWGICCTQATKQARESTVALKPRADITRSPKQGYQWPHKKDLCPAIFFIKKHPEVTKINMLTLRPWRVVTPQRSLD